MSAQGKRKALWLLRPQAERCFASKPYGKVTTESSALDCGAVLSLVSGYQYASACKPARRSVTRLIHPTIAQKLAPARL